MLEHAGEQVGKVKMEGTKQADQTQRQNFEQVFSQKEEYEAELESWRQSVNELKTSGYLSQNDISPSKVKEVIHVIMAHKAQLESEIKNLYRKEAETQFALADRTMEWLELRKRQATLAQGTEPSIIQLKQCLLDPAVHSEVMRLKGEVDKREEQIRSLREELQAATFTPDSAAGRELVKKCKQLQQENDDLGKELAEENVQMYKLQIKLKDEEKEHWRQLYYQMEDHAVQLEEENDDLSNELFTLKRTGESYNNMDVNGEDGGAQYKTEPRFGRRGMALISKDKDKINRYVRPKNSR
eukprot:TRINITY_DN3146_c0_g1_i1.p2 TRINITY_DN3146_c0_g1~~TRINITY_DN3146_c0_g1_i1.p2  ORF type:complete len:298 (+),score=47.61 TRINITY_DN3146_c0_g1_i1:52-945(+)